VCGVGSRLGVTHGHTVRGCESCPGLHANRNTANE